MEDAGPPAPQEVGEASKRGRPRNNAAQKQIAEMRVGPGVGFRANLAKCPEMGSRSRGLESACLRFRNNGDWSARWVGEQARPQGAGYCRTRSAVNGGGGGVWVWGGRWYVMSRNALLSADPR